MSDIAPGHSETVSKKQLRPNFTCEDLQVLVDAVATNKGKLFGKFGNAITASSKTFIWDKIANVGNDTVTCTGEEVKRKRTDWSSATKTKHAKIKVTHRMTGRRMTDRP